MALTNLYRQLLLLLFLFFIGFLEGFRPEIVNIGAIFSLPSINGRVADIAMRAAVDDVNSQKFLGNNTKLALSVHDSEFNTFVAILGGLQLMEQDNVAIIGPQVSEIAHILSHLANELQKPMLSFTALDPSLSSLQYPYFIQTSPNDLFQMTAIADMISHFGFHNVVVVYTDDDERRGGVASLGDELAERRCAISYKAVLSPGNSSTDAEIRIQLLKIMARESRVIVLHSYAVMGLRILKLANELKMLEEGYVWIATTWLSTVLDSTPSVVANETYIEGTLTLRPHTCDSNAKREFLSRWKTLSNGSIGLNPYGLYAYDTVWIVADAVKRFFEQGGNISFSDNPYLNSFGEGGLNLSALSTFDGGDQLRELILQTNMTGLTGKIAFDSHSSVVFPAFDLLNIVNMKPKQIGYWSNYSGLSVMRPDILYGKPANRSSSNQKLYMVVWPGNTTTVPRGWVFPQNGRKLRFGVPNRFSFKPFVYKEENTSHFDGYCMEVFRHAVNLLPYPVPYEFVLFGDGQENPSYFELINKISSNELDGAIGDIAIVTNRTKIVDFTQPYTESGLVVVAPSRKVEHGTWAFLRPFTPTMWAVTVFLSLFVGFVVWVLEHQINEEFSGSVKKQFVTIFSFGLSSMFFAHRENTIGTLGRIVLLIWLFVVLIINSSYTASLSSILTIEQLAPSIRGIESLAMTNDRIGFQTGSFSQYYLSEELNIAKSRLVPLGSPQEYADALTTGRVAAIVDERPYVELFLANYCNFQIVGREFTKSGWGAFRRESPLAVDMSTAILNLSENRVLENIRMKWLHTTACGANPGTTNQLQYKNFKGLFIICGIACGGAVLIYLCMILHKFIKYAANEGSDSEAGSVSFSSSVSVRIQRFLSFVDEKEDELKERLKRKRAESQSLGRTCGE